MGLYLEDHRPARRQYRNPRRSKPTGAIVIHTAENNPDLTLPDDGAEAVARFIARRTDAAGSYHSIVDSDSVVHLGRYEWEMFHDGTGGNRWSLGLSFACRAAQWPDLPEAWVDGAISRGAWEAADMAAWVESETGVTVPAARITADEYRAGKPGFTSHAELDPGRRSDPGEHFPWEKFLWAFRLRRDQTNPGEPAPMAEKITLPANRDATIKRIQTALGVAADGDPYLLTAEAAERREADLDELATELAESGAKIVELTDEWEANLISIQNYLRAYDYEGALDAKFGPKTMAAWKRSVDAQASMAKQNRLFERAFDQAAGHLDTVIELMETAAHNAALG